MEGILLSNVPIGTEVVIESEEELRRLHNEGYEAIIVHADEIFEVYGHEKAYGTSKELLHLSNEHGSDISVYAGEFRFLHPESLPPDVFMKETEPAPEVIAASEEDLDMFLRAWEVKT